MTRLSRLKLSARLCNLGLNPNAARPLARFLSRLFRPYDKTFKVETLSARLCNLGLNPNAAQPLARFLPRLSRIYMQTFQTRTVGANLQFGSKSGCGATLGATHVLTFQTFCPDFPDSNYWRESAI